MQRPQAQAAPYDDPSALARVMSRLGALPPLVTPWEIDRLRAQLAEAELGKRFVLQGGDCAESLADCRPESIENRLKILLQMSLVIIHSGRKPVIRIGRFAGQYAKPRSSATETQGDATLPAYFGDLVNRPEFTAAARRPDPELLLAGYHHAALTLNHVRSLAAGGFADLHHPEYWDLSFLARADLSAPLRAQYTRMSETIGEALRFMEAITQAPLGDLGRVEFFTSHEGLSLHYESAQTRAAAHAPGFYDLTTHLPWIGERTRDPAGAHVELFRGVKNPIGLKLGPKAKPGEVVSLLELLNPGNEAGKLVLITRLGADHAVTLLPPLLQAVKHAGRRALWLCDPMHGNTRVTQGGLKTRDFADISRELVQTMDAHAAQGSTLGGLHLELTGDDVTECIGGGISETDLDRNYASLCDPRLNYRQALELAFAVGARLRDAR